MLSADTVCVISRQTEGHSFSDHLISESVSVTPSSVTEASIVLCSVSLWLVWAKCPISVRSEHPVDMCWWYYKDAMSKVIDEYGTMIAISSPSYVQTLVSF
jgi:hypothetical protein